MLVALASPWGGGPRGLQDLAQPLGAVFAGWVADGSAIRAAPTAALLVFQHEHSTQRQQQG